jgi:hypothetical protein
MSDALDTPHEKMLATVKALKKRKEQKARKKQRDIDGATAVLIKTLTGKNITTGYSNKKSSFY